MAQRGSSSSAGPWDDRTQNTPAGNAYHPGTTQRNPPAYAQQHPSTHTQQHPSSYTPQHLSPYGQQHPPTYGQQYSSTYEHQHPAAYGQQYPPPHGQQYPRVTGQPRDDRDPADTAADRTSRDFDFDKAVETGSSQEGRPYEDDDDQVNVPPRATTSDRRHRHRTHEFVRERRQQLGGSKYQPSSRSRRPRERRTRDAMATLAEFDRSYNPQDNSQNDDIYATRQGRS
ncbi:Fc.00g059100.m01.CDS01 [Cosmosporella sp. VM-42]